MNKFTKAAIATLVGVASLAPTFTSAEAGDWRNDHRRPIYRHHNNDALAAGILGLAAAALDHFEWFAVCVFRRRHGGRLAPANPDLKRDVAGERGKNLTNTPACSFLCPCKQVPSC